MADKVATRLQRIWFDLLTGSEDTSSNARLESVAAEWWHTVQDHYCENARHYHTLTHLQTMFDLQQEYEGKLKSHKAVSWAIFFHDVIYNPKTNDNEVQSATLFKKFASECLQNELDVSQQAYDLIIATKHHMTEIHKTPSMYGDDDVHYFLDFDMQVLGWAQEDYDEYAKQIRQEYIHIPHQDYCVGRSKVLSTFLETPNIFATKDFRDRFEAQARSNIQREIEHLQKASVS